MSTNPETPSESHDTPTDAASMVGIQDVDLGAGHADDSQTGETPETPDTGAAHPSDDGSDLTFLSDDLQSAIRDNPDMTVGELLASHRDALERGYMRRDRFSRDKNALRAEQDELAADREAAARYRALIRDPRAREALEPVLSGEQSKQGAESFEMPEGVEEWTAAEVLTYMQKREASLTERLEREIRDKVMGEINAPSTRASEFDHVANRYMEDNDVSLETMQAAANLIAEDGELYASLTAQTLPGALRLAVRQVESDQRLKSYEDESRAEAEKIQRARAASPRGQRGAAAPSKRSFEEENGREFDADAQYDKLAQRLGASESDLDRSLFRR